MSAKEQDRLAKRRKTKEKIGRDGGLSDNYQPTGGTVYVHALPVVS